MANSLNVDLTDKVVRFKPGVLKPEYAHMTFKVSGGFGASPFTSGRALFGEFEDGEKCRMNGEDVLEIVEDGS